MDNKFNKQEDLQQLVSRVEQAGKEQPKKVTVQAKVADLEQDIDILNLPPRKVVHDTKNRAKVKISFPMLRFIIVIIVLVAILIAGYYYGGTELINLFR